MWSLPMGRRKQTTKERTMSKEAEEYLKRDEVVNVEHYIVDDRANNWHVIEVSDLPEILEAYKDHCVNAIRKQHAKELSETYESGREDGFNTSYL